MQGKIRMVALRRLFFAGSLALAAGCSGTSGGPGPAGPAALAPAALAPAMTQALRSTAAGGAGRPVANEANALDPVGGYVVAANAGTNVEGVVDYSVAQQFVDAMRQSRPWGNPTTPYDQAVAQAGEVDANGWPTVDAGVLVLCCVTADGSAADPGSASLLTGTYQLSFRGKANVGIPIGSGNVAAYQYDAAANASSAQVTFTNAGPGSGEALYLSFTQTQRTASSPVGSGITNVKLIRPQLAPSGLRWWTTPTQIFTDPFLATLHGYSTLRFMDWAATNGSPVVNWSDRTPETYSSNQRQILYNGTWQPTGAAWGDAIALANATNEDMWVNVPAMATDDYVKSLARTLRGLHGNRHVYVEYSNEVWNGIFPQFAYNLALAEAEAQTNPGYKANCSPTDEYRWGQCRVAERLMQISNDFASVDGPAAIGTTIRPVFATQEDQTYDLGGALNFIAKTYGPPASFFYGIAQAPYWEGDQTLANQTEQQELQAAEASLTATVPSSTADFTAYAILYGLHNFTYEGGPGMSGTPSLAAKIAANLDPAMGAQVTQALDDFFTRGGDLFMYYDDTSAYNQYGMWGSTEDVFNLAAPKFTALQAIRGTSQIRSVGVRMPGTVLGTAYQIELAPGGYGATDYFYYRNGESLAYLVETPAAGSYALTLTVGSYSLTPGVAAIFINGRPFGSLVTPTTGGNPATEATTAPLAITLARGLSIINVAETSSEFGLYHMTVAAPAPGAVTPHATIHRPAR